MINKRTIILSVHLIVTLCFLSLFLSLTQAADVTLTIGNGSGLPGATSIPIAVSLENPDHKIEGVEILIQDVDDYLVFSGCETTDRSAGFEYLANEIIEHLDPYQPDLRGYCRVILVDMESEALIEEGSGPIFLLTFQVKTSAPIGECRDLNLIKELGGYVYIEVLDENRQSLDVTLESGEFCFDSATTTTTTIITDTTTTTIINDTSTTTTITDTSTTTTITDTSTTTTTPDISIEVTPTEVLRSRWIPLIWLMNIKGTETNFELFKTRVDYNSKSVMRLPALVISPTDIYQIILVMPSWLTAIWKDETITVTVEGVSDTFEIKMLQEPFDNEKNLM